jgi:hypothetical protein
MKIDRLETHDRMQEFMKNDFDIAACCQDMINKRPFGNNPFYIFAHARTDDDGVRKRLIWQPRLTKPKAQTNSMLFKAYPGTDLIKVIWILPAREMWAQYEKNKVTASKIVCDSIRLFENNRSLLEAREEDDLHDWQINTIYRQLSEDARRRKVKQDSSAVSLSSESGQPSSPQSPPSPGPLSL